MNHARKILLCWELGGGNGHLTCLTRLAAELSGRGHYPVIALNRDQKLHPVAAVDTAVETVEAPALPTLDGDSTFRARSLADILGQCGFADSSQLNTRIHRWRELIANVAPDVILCDFSPFVCLAAKGMVRTISVGTGFASPPSNLDSFPILNPNVASGFDVGMLTNHARHVANLNASPTTASLVSMTTADQSIVRCFASFDPYQSTRQQNVAGPIEVMQWSERPHSNDWPERIYVYLSGSHPSLNRIVRAIESANIAGKIFVSSTKRSLIETVETAHLQVLPEMPGFAQVLTDVSLVIHHGGIGTAQACAAAGIPQLLIPNHLEQELTAASILRQGIGACLIPPYTGDDITRGTKRLMSVNKYRENAQAIARDISRGGPYGFVQRVMEAAESTEP